MSVNSFCAEAPRRAVTAMLRALGGSEIAIRVSQPMGELDQRGLGLQQYDVSEIKLAPAIVRQMKPAPEAQWEAVIPASEIEAKLGPDPDTTAAALQLGTAMVWNNRVLRIAAVACEQFAGREYLYRITLGE